MQTAIIVMLLFCLALALRRKPPRLVPPPEYQWAPVPAVPMEQIFHGLSLVEGMPAVTCGGKAFIFTSPADLQTGLNLSRAMMTMAEETVAKMFLGRQ
jgi:hypothetical protein